MKKIILTLSIKLSVFSGFFFFVRNCLLISDRKTVPGAFPRVIGEGTPILGPSRAPTWRPFLPIIGKSLKREIGSGGSAGMRRSAWSLPLFYTWYPKNRALDRSAPITLSISLLISLSNNWGDECFGESSHSYSSNQSFLLYSSSRALYSLDFPFYRWISLDPLLHLDSNADQIIVWKARESWSIQNEKKNTRESTFKIL